MLSLLRLKLTIELQSHPLLIMFLLEVIGSELIIQLFKFYAHLAKLLLLRVSILCESIL